MSKATTIALVDLFGQHATASTVSNFYDDVIELMGHDTDWLTTASLVTLTPGTAVYAPPSTAVRTLSVFYDDKELSHESARGIEATAGESWRDELGTPSAYVTEDESNKDFRLYPQPTLASKDFIPFLGSPLGLDFPEYSAITLDVETRETVPEWMELLVAFRVLALEFSYASNHRDAAFAKMCGAIADMLHKVFA